MKLSERQQYMLENLKRPQVTEQTCHSRPGLKANIRTWNSLIRLGLMVERQHNFHGTIVTIGELTDKGRAI